jgi:hypothetical protein
MAETNRLFLFHHPLICRLLSQKQINSFSLWNVKYHCCVWSQLRRLTLVCAIDEQIKWTVVRLNCKRLQIVRIYLIVDTSTYKCSTWWKVSQSHMTSFSSRNSSCKASERIQVIISLLLMDLRWFSTGYSRVVRSWSDDVCWKMIDNTCGPMWADKMSFTNRQRITFRDEVSFRVNGMYCSRVDSISSEELYGKRW